MKNIRKMKKRVAFKLIKKYHNIGAIKLYYDHIKEWKNIIKYTFDDSLGNNMLRYGFIDYDYRMIIKLSKNIKQKTIKKYIKFKNYDTRRIYTIKTPIVELFVEEIKSKLKNKKIEFVNEKNIDNCDKITAQFYITPCLFFGLHEISKRIPTNIKDDIINNVVKILNKEEENNFKFYEPIKLQLDYLTTIDEYKQECGTIKLVVTLYVEKY